MSRTLMIALVTLFAASMVHGQTPGASAITIKALMVEALGNTADPKVTVLSLPVPAERAAGPHTHAGPVFAYILQGDIENQVDPDPPKTYHAGDFFFEPQMHVHRLLRNLNKAETAKLIVFQVGDTGKAAPAIKTLLQEPAEIANREGHLSILTAAPGGTAAAHKHPGPIFAYILKGEIQNQVDPGEPKVYRAGDVFYEPPLHVHRLFRNLSSTESAELLLFEIAEKGQPLVMGAN